MSYSVQNIRNVCLLGHSGAGKTALAESLLFMTGALKRMGTSADGNTVCDYDPEEIRRQISISTAVAPWSTRGCKINLLDTPGAFDFTGEVMEALRAADAAIIVCSAKDGISVGFEKSLEILPGAGTCLALSISPRPTRTTATTTPPSTPCGRSTAIRLPPGGAHVGRRQEHHRPHRRAQQAGL